MSASARSTASRAQNTPVVRTLARAGFAVNGLLNVLIGLLALGVVGGGEDAGPGGALAGVAAAPGGLVLIVVIVVGLAALGVWQFASAALERDPDRRRRWMSRAKLIGKGVAYLVLAAIGVRVALEGSGGGGAEEDLTARALATPGGVVLIVLIGLGTIAVGGYLVVKGVTQRFLDDLDAPSGTLGTATIVLGTVGYVARGIAFGVIGVLFVVAAVSSDSARAGGLDDALATLRTLPFGPMLLVVVALGFVAFGVYSGVRARYARL